MNAWLDRVGVSTDAWMAFITRAVLRRTWAEEIESVLDRYSPSSRQLVTEALAEGLCSGLFDEFERSLCEKAATVFDIDSACFQRSPSSEAHADAAIRLARQHTPWLESRPVVDMLTRLRTILEINALYCAASERVATDEALLEVIEANRLEWVVIDTDTLSFDDESAAREAVLCVTEDRLSLADVGALSRHAIIRTHGFLADVPSEYRHRLVAAEPGQVIGPLPGDGRFHVTVVTGRAAPTLADSHVKQRARAALLGQIARRAAREHITRRRSL